MNTDRALDFAIEAAGAAADIFSDNGPEDMLRLGWPMLMLGVNVSIAERGTAACRDVLAPFVRANPAAPVEAMFIQAEMKGIHPNNERNFADLPFALRAAHRTFHAALLLADKMLAEESARLAQHIPSGRQTQRPSVEQHAMERIDDRDDREGFGRTAPIPRTAAKAMKPATQPKET